MVMNAMVFYNLIHYFNRNVLNPNQAQKQLKTLRAEDFILPAQLGNSAGDWVLRVFAAKNSGEGFAIFLKELCVSRTVSTAMRLLRQDRKNGEIQDFNKTMRPAT